MESVWWHKRREKGATWMLERMKVFHAFRKNVFRELSGFFPPKIFSYPKVKTETQHWMELECVVSEDNWMNSERRRCSPDSVARVTACRETAERRRRLSLRWFIFSPFNRATYNLTPITAWHGKLFAHSSILSQFESHLPRISSQQLFNIVRRWQNGLSLQDCVAILTPIEFSLYSVSLRLVSSIVIIINFIFNPCLVHAGHRHRREDCPTRKQIFIVAFLK